MKDIHQILNEYWGFDHFRPLQEDIIRAVLQENDVLALMPTGGGKSLCYQVPVMMKPGLGLVISPLIALMKDQVEGLKRKGITAFAVYSGMSRKELVNTLRIAGDSNCKFLFVSPERLETRIFQEYLPGLHINLIAVDEAHCISQWGYDFRPSYLKIAAIREYLSDIPVLALTASATGEVQKDICDKLGVPRAASNSTHIRRDWKIFRQSFARPNLSYSVFRVDSKINKIIEVIEKVPGSSIVYCRSRKRTKEISDLLKLQNISADFYHAGLSGEERNRKQDEWINDKNRVIVCTNAFGMGIDKPAVRTVVHADLPDCLENYYQEAGRAGRDGKRSYAVLVIEEKDINDLKNLSALKFPGLEDIRMVYKAISNYLQVAAGSGDGEYYDFDIPDFLKKFKINATTTINVLHVLEQEGWVSFTEQLFLPSTIGFICSKQTVYDFEMHEPALEPLIKTLLRSYEGIFDQAVPISEKFIAGLLRIDPAELIKKFDRLQRAGIIEYIPQKDKPQLLFTRPRVKAEDLTIDMAAYLKRKNAFEKRVAAMIGFVTDTRTCRSRQIGNYFGDKALPDCGICDNCLNKKQSVLAKKEFETIREEIISTLKNQPLHIRELNSRIINFEKEKAWSIIEFMQSEKIIEMDEQGMVRLLPH